MFLENHKDSKVEWKLIDFVTSFFVATFFILLYVLHQVCQPSSLEILVKMTNYRKFGENRQKLVTADEANFHTKMEKKIIHQ